MGSRISQTLFASMLTIGAFSLSLQSLDEPLVAQADGNKAEEKAEDKGRELYADALESLSLGSTRAVKRTARKLKKIEGFEAKALWLTSRVELEYGDSRKALKALDKAKASQSSDPLLRALYCQALYMNGDYVRYHQAAEVFTQANASSPHALFHRGRSLFMRGEKSGEGFFELAVRAASKADTTSSDLITQFESAEALQLAGDAFEMMGSIQNASEAYYDGTESYEYHNGCKSGVGFNLLRNGKKHRSALVNAAEPLLLFNAKSIPGLLLKAEVHGFEGKVVEEGRVLDRALGVNRKSWPVLIARAKYFITYSNFPAAEEALEKAKAYNSSALEYIALKGLLALLQGDTNAFDLAEVDALKLNSKSGLFHLIVAKGLRRHQMLDQAREILKRGIERDQKEWRLHRELGWTLSDLGKIEEALPYLNNALDRDTIRNAVDTGNLIKLYEQYLNEQKSIPILDGKVIIKVMDADSALLLPYFEQHISQSLVRFTKAYGAVVIDKPITITIFPDLETFSNRDRLFDAFAVNAKSYGRQINILSPKARAPQAFNWASTLQHELDHCVQAILSDAAIPQWLADGASVYHESLARPEWRRHAEEELYQLHAEGGIPSVVEFNTWFHDEARAPFAYYLAGEMVRFIAEKIGNKDSVHRMIRDFGGAFRLEQVFERNLGMTPKEFDSAFAKHVSEKLSKYKIFPSVKLDDPRDLIEKAEDSEASVNELTRLARWYFQQDKGSPDARKWAGLAVKMGGESAELYYVRGMLAKHDPSGSMSKNKQFRLAKEYLSKAINMGLEDYYLYLEMADVVAQERDQDAAIFFLNRARRAFPTSPLPIERLIGVYGQANNIAKVQELAQDLVMLDKVALQQRNWLLNRYQEVGDYEKAADMALQLININPYMIDTHLVRGKMLRELGDADAAIFEFMRAYDASGLHESAAAARQGKESSLLEVAQTYLDESRDEELEALMTRLEDEFKGSARVAHMRKRIAAVDTEVFFP